MAPCQRQTRKHQHPCRKQILCTVAEPAMVVVPRGTPRRGRLQVYRDSRMSGYNAGGINPGQARLARVAERLVMPYDSAAHESARLVPFSPTAISADTVPPYLAFPEPGLDDPPPIMKAIRPACTGRQRQRVPDLPEGSHRTRGAPLPMRQRKRPPSPFGTPAASQPKSPWARRGHPHGSASRRWVSYGLEPRPRHDWSLPARFHAVERDFQYAKARYAAPRLRSVPRRRAVGAHRPPRRS